MANDIIYKTSINKAERNNSHSLAREFVNDCGSALNVLEVGCASGYFGLALQKDGHKVQGIEPYTPAASEAIAAGLDVMPGTFDDYCKKFPNQKFDVITFGDVLEHLVDPGAALRTCLQHLNPGGSVVCSIPNVAHVSVRALLLEGRWEYKKTGILDETHLRFFCRNQFEKLISSSGLKVESSQAVRLTAQQADRIFDLNLSNRMVDAVEKMAANDPELDVFQYVYRLRPSNETRRRPIKIPGRIWVVSDRSDDDHFDARIRRALNQLARITITEITYYRYEQLINNPLQGVDVIIFQQAHTDLHCEIATRAHQENIPYVYDLDDVISTPTDQLNFPQKTGEEKNNILRILKNAEILTVPTESLAREFRGACKGISIIPDTPIDQHIKYDTTKTIEFVIAAPHDESIEIVAAAINKLAATHTKGFSVRVIGTTNTDFNKIFNVTPTKHPPLQRDKLVNSITSLENAVLVIPLNDEGVNACTSSIKFLDFSAAGIVVLASNVAPYKNIDPQKIPGLLVDNNVDSWFSTMDELVREPYRLQKIQLAESMRTARRTQVDVALDWAQALTNIPSRVRHNPAVLTVDYGMRQKPPLRKFIKKFFDDLRELNRKRIKNRRKNRTEGA